MGRPKFDEFYRQLHLRRFENLISGRDVLIIGTGPQAKEIDVVAAKKAGMTIIGVNGAPLCADPALFDILLSMHYKTEETGSWRWQDAKNALYVTQVDYGTLERRRLIIFHAKPHEISRELPYLKSGGTSTLCAVNLCLILKARNVWLAGVQMTTDKHAYEGIGKASHGPSHWRRMMSIADTMRGAKIGYYQTTTDTRVKLPVMPLPGVN
jgi:hypothetical protein